MKHQWDVRARWASAARHRQIFGRCENGSNHGDVILRGSRLGILVQSGAGEAEALLLLTCMVELGKTERCDRKRKRNET